MIDDSHKTAMSRKTPSAPIRYLDSKGLLVGNKLDYGSGKGLDADTYQMDKYDLNYHPEYPCTKYSTITCSYVLNVVQRDEVESIIENIRKLLKPHGIAYITVRRDIKTEGYTSKGTYQHNVILDLPVLYEKKKNYCIYILKN